MKQNKQAPPIPKHQAPAHLPPVTISSQITQKNVPNIRKMSSSVSEAMMCPIEDKNKNQGFQVRGDGAQWRKKERKRWDVTGKAVPVLGKRGTTPGFGRSKEQEAREGAVEQNARTWASGARSAYGRSRSGARAPGQRHREPKT
jgi:hypothetical protein